MKCKNVSSGENHQCKTTYSRKFPLKMFTYRKPTPKEIKKGNFFGYVQCDLEVPDCLRSNFAIFPPIFMNRLVGRKDMRDTLERYAEGEGEVTQTGK